MTPAPHSYGKWLSFHVFLPEAFDFFLLECLLPALEAELVARRVKRFFFIRYSEKGNHLRLRFLPHAATDAAAIEQCVGEITSKFTAGTGITAERCTVERHVYDRSELYFGETPASVYAELLNEQSSYLCLRLLQARLSDRSHLLLILSSTLALILAGCEQSASEYLDATSDSRAFAARGLEKMGYPVDRLTEERPSLSRALRQSIPEVAKRLGGDPQLNRLIRLLKRTRIMVPKGRSVGAHALHLLCNKMGFSFIDEFRIFEALCRAEIYEVISHRERSYD